MRMKGSLHLVIGSISLVFAGCQEGRALWATYSTRTVFHVEGGKANRPRVVKFQLRPDPLAN